MILFCYISCILTTHLHLCLSQLVTWNISGVAVKLLLQAVNKIRLCDKTGSLPLSLSLSLCLSVCSAVHIHKCRNAFASLHASVAFIYMPACSLPHSRRTLNLLPYPLTSCLPHTTRCMVLNCPADPHMNLHSSRAHQRVQPLPGCNYLEEALATAFSLGMCQWLRRCVYTYICLCVAHVTKVLDALGRGSTVVQLAAII